MHLPLDRGTRMGRGVPASLIATARSRAAAHVLVLTVVVLLPALFSGGCGGPGRGEQAAAKPDATPQDHYAVRIDRADVTNASLASADTPRRRPPRAFLSEFSGVGRTRSDDRGPEGLAAAREAAIIEAFFMALMDMRRVDGTPTSDFAVDLSERLLASHRTEDGAEVLELRLLTRGAETFFRVRDGLLQHPAHDFELIRQVFAETEGRFSLLSAELLDSPRSYVARVGCYEPAGPIEALAGMAHEP